MGAENIITIQVQVPVDVPDNEKTAFEDAVTSFIFGYDRLRPEIEAALKYQGIDVNTLARLSEPERLGVCPTPGALEFVPGGELMELTKKAGINLTNGGAIHVAFNYDAYAGKKYDGESLELLIELPDALGDVTDEDVGIVTQAFFGNCQLSRRAQDYLRAHNVDLVEVAATAMKGSQGSKPVTVRVRRDVERTLAKFGLNADQSGRLTVSTSKDQSILGDETIMWKKTTCC